MSHPSGFSATARVGREKQVYEDNVRQVAGCIPVDPHTGKVLLVQSRRRPGAWVFPKGGWENDEALEDCAKRETFEEAGVAGDIVRNLGKFADIGWDGEPKAMVWIFEMHVKQIYDEWPEIDERARRWFTAEEAMEGLVGKPFMREALLLSSISPSKPSEEATAVPQPKN